MTVTVADLRFFFLLPKITLVAREGAVILGSVQWGDLWGKPTWKPSRMHRYQGGTSSILYNMSNFGSVGRDTGGSLVEVPAGPRSSRWGQQRAVTQGGEVDTGKATSAPESIRCLSGLSAPRNGV